MLTDLQSNYQLKDFPSVFQPELHSHDDANRFKGAYCNAPTHEHVIQVHTHVCILLCVMVMDL